MPATLRAVSRQQGNQQVQTSPDEVVAWLQEDKGIGEKGWVASILTLALRAEGVVTTGLEGLHVGRPDCE